MGGDCLKLMIIIILLFPDYISWEIFVIESLIVRTHYIFYALLQYCTLVGIALLEAAAKATTRL